MYRNRIELSRGRWKFIMNYNEASQCSRYQGPKGQNVGVPKRLSTTRSPDNQRRGRSSRFLLARPRYIYSIPSSSTCFLFDCIKKTISSRYLAILSKVGCWCLRHANKLHRVVTANTPSTPSCPDWQGALNLCSQLDAGLSNHWFPAFMSP